MVSGLKSHKKKCHDWTINDYDVVNLKGIFLKLVNIGSFMNIIMGVSITMDFCMMLEEDNA
jgi:hypothetical protein